MRFRLGLVLLASWVLACTPPRPSAGAGRRGDAGLPTSCAPGSVVCAGDQLRICADDGLSRATVACRAGETCFEGACVLRGLVPEAGNRPEAGAGRDASITPADSGGRRDSGIGGDTAVALDSGAPFDAGANQDSGAHGDAGASADGGEESDAGPARLGDLVVQLRWDHPTSDVDVHLLREGNATHYTSTNDCYYANCKPRNGQPRLSWGPGGTADDPSLDLDDINGFGPELISIDDPEVAQRYLVGVHYYRDAPGNNGQGRETIATISVYVFGELAYENSVLLAQTGAWWEAVVIEWPEGRVREVGQVSAEPPR